MPAPTATIAALTAGLTAGLSARQQPAPLFAFKLPDNIAKLPAIFYSLTSRNEHSHDGGAAGRGQMLELELTVVTKTATAAVQILEQLAGAVDELPARSTDTVRFSGAVVVDTESPVFDSDRQEWVAYLNATALAS